MEGLEGAAELLRAGLAARVPDKLRELEERLELEAGALPNPKLVTPHELPVVGLEDWPAIMVVGQETLPGALVVDHTPDGGVVYSIRYAFRVFAFIRGEQFSDTDLTRKRFVLAIREVLLGKLALDPSLGYVEPATVAESYSDVAIDPKARATVAAAYTAFELILLEELAPALPAYGPLAATDVDTVLLPPHPALGP